MKYLNLTKGFELYSQEPYVIEFETFTFKGGEPHIKLKDNQYAIGDEVFITHQISSFNDMGLLQIAVDALRRINSKIKLQLFLPYFPAARQDRVMIEGEPFTSAVYVKALDAMGFEQITSFDLHSDVIGGMFGVLNTKFIQISNHKFVWEVLKDIYPQRNAKNPILISPDAGSNKKIGALAKYLADYNKLDVVKCDKTRDIRTGEITNFEVYADDLENRDCIIVDDICDGGGTFLGLVDKLYDKGAGNVYLAVSHGIFSKGLKELVANFSGIYTTNSVNPLKYFNGVVPKVFKIIKLNKVI
jgi:ribose-phosphate pyrophosphokinase